MFMINGGSPVLDQKGETIIGLDAVIYTKFRGRQWNFTLFRSDSSKSCEWSCNLKKNVLMQRGEGVNAVHCNNTFKMTMHSNVDVTRANHSPSCGLSLSSQFDI
jgi:hypothetical protein